MHFNFLGFRRHISLRHFAKWYSLYLRFLEKLFHRRKIRSRVRILYLDDSHPKINLEYPSRVSLLLKQLDFFNLLFHLAIHSGLLKVTGFTRFAIELKQLNVGVSNHFVVLGFEGVLLLDRQPLVAFLLLRDHFVQVILQLPVETVSAQTTKIVHLFLPLVVLIIAIFF